MRVLQVIDYLDSGGAERIVVDLTRELNIKGLKTDLLIFKSGGDFEHWIDKDHIINLNRENKFSLIKLKQVSNILDNYDIAHVHLTYNYKYIALAKKLFGTKTKLILHDHYGDYDVVMPKDWALKFLFRPEYYVGVDERLTNWAREYLMVPERSAFLLRNSVRNNTESPTENYETADLVMISNIRRTKNIEFAIEVAQRTGLSLTIFGKINDPVYFAELNEKARENDICFIHDCDNIVPYLGRFRMGIHTSKSESGPLALIEFLNSDLSFVAYNSGEVTKVVKNIIPEFVLESFDINKWVAKINEIRKDDDKYLPRIRECSEEFGYNEYINKCQEIYHQIEN